MERNYNRLIEESPSEYRCIDIQLMKDGKIKYGTAGCSGPMSYYTDASNKSSNNLSLTYQEMIMKKISVMEDKTNQKLVEDLFDDKDDKADSDKKRRMVQEYADRFETYQQYINGEISSREYSYN